MSVAITATDLTRKFGDFTAVDHLQLRVGRGQVFGFLGPNGCGKSTTIRMLCGLLRPTSGEVNVLGLEIPAEAERLKFKAGYMTQAFSLYKDLTVLENLRFMADIYGLDKTQKKKRIEILLDQYWLRDIARQISGSLSGGQRQRLALAAAVIHQPDLLLLDEPTSAVDPQSRRDFWESLFELVDHGATILVSTHFMDEAERCHELAILDQGKKVADGSPKKLMQEVNAHIVTVDCGEIAAVRRSIIGQPGILGVTQLGLSLRVLVDRHCSDPEQKVRQIVHDFGQTATVKSVSANLEDVFVVATGGKNREQPT